MYSKKMRFAGCYLGTLELSQDVEGINKTFIVLNIYLEPSVDLAKALEVVEKVFDSVWKVVSKKNLNGNNYIQISFTLPAIIRNKYRFLRSKAHHIARLLITTSEQIWVYNSFLEHEASFFPGYVAGVESLRAYRNGQIDRTGHFIR